MDNPLDMTKQTLERLEAEASEPEYHVRSVATPSEKEKKGNEHSRVAVEVLEDRRLSSEYDNMQEVCKKVTAPEVVQEERRVPERRPSIEYEMMPPPPSPAMRPKSATPRREFSQPRYVWIRSKLMQ